MHPSLERLIALAGSGRKRPAVHSLTAIADLINASPQMLNNWRKRGVSSYAAAHAAEVFGGTASHILNGTPLDQSTASTRGVAQEMIQYRPTLKLPKVAWEDLKMGKRPDKPFEIDVVDDALAPEIFTGCIAMMDPARPPEPGWPVLVVDREGNPYLRDYKVGVGTRWGAVPRAAQKEFFDALDSDAHGLELIAAMDGYRRPRRQ